MSNLAGGLGALQGLASESWTVAGYAAHWLENVARPRLKPATFMSSRETLRLHILPTLGRVKVQALRPDQVRTLLAHKVAEGLSARSVQIVHGTLRTMLGEAVRQEVITRNPAAVVRPPAVTREEVKPWSPQQASKFLRASVGHRLYAVFAVGVALGLRRGELLALRWSDVDLDQGLVHVRQNVQRLLEIGSSTAAPRPVGLAGRFRFQPDRSRSSVRIKHARRRKPWLSEHGGLKPGLSSHRRSGQ